MYFPSPPTPLPAKAGRGGQDFCMKKDKIIIKGARVNNLKNIDVEIPKDKLVVITGLSGSGKSSLAFDTIFAEGNRRYLEGMSNYARQFLNISAKPDVDRIENLSPTISIDQRSAGQSPRSTVGTLTEIYDYLRVLYAKMGMVFCPKCGLPMQRKSTKEMLEEILDFPDKTSMAILAKIKNNGKSTKEILKNVSQLGYARIRFNGKIMMVKDAALTASENLKDDIEVVVDRMEIDKRKIDKERILDSIETALRLGSGFFIVSVNNEKDLFFNRDFVCRECFFRLNEITPKHFSFNNPEGACEHCSGLGITKEVEEELVIPNKNLSLSEGAIMPWSRMGGRTGGQGSYLNMLKALSEKYKFSLDEPVKKLPQNVLAMILHGTNGEEIKIKQKNDSGDVKEIKMVFEGVIPMLKRKYNEASSDSSRSEIERYMIEKVCPVCQGKRLKKEYLSVLVNGKSIDEISDFSLANLKIFLEELNNSKNSASGKKIAEPLIKEMIARTKALFDVGLDYLSLSRRANSISGGEAQRIRLATQINSELSGIVYVLDEPSLGLHSRDTEKLIGAMKNLRDGGNSLVVVEHDEMIIRQADWIVDMGPGAGEDGGEMVFSGNAEKLRSAKSLTADYLNGRKKVSNKKSFRRGNGKYLEVSGAKEHNLKNVNLEIPLGKLVCITGVSGSGKSTLVNDILSKALSKHFYKTKEMPGEYEKIKGLEHIGKVISIDQSPIGKTPRSNAATYTGVFSLVRDLFSQTEEARKRNYAPSRFSFNMKGGRCESCQGDGIKKIEMYLLPDVYVKCEECNGTRYNRGTLEIEYQGVNVAEVLDMSVSYALNFFRKSPLIAEKLKTLEEVGLGYLKLGQSATNLSGGEAQRIKLATELARKATGNTLYILDEPTVGLHFEDVRKLLGVLEALVAKGNTVLVVEHNTDVIRSSDWVIDLGPEGGDKGGEIIFAGTPDGIKKCKKSWTGRYL